MLSLQEILDNSTEIRRLCDRIKITGPVMHLSSEHRKAHDVACKEYHQRFDSLAFPGGGAMLNRVRQNDPIAIESAIRFLVADPYHFRSGYIKEYLWRWLKHCELSMSARNRLEMAALLYMDRRVSREFWDMCKSMALLGRDSFWVSVAQKARLTDLPAKRAGLLLVHGANLRAGAHLRWAIWHENIMRKGANYAIKVTAE